MASIESRLLLQDIEEPEAGEHRLELLMYGQRQPAYRTNQQWTVAGLLEEAARIKYGRFLYTSAAEGQLQRFWDNLRVRHRTKGGRAINR